MKNSIVIGPIQKAKPMTERAAILDQRLSKMKVGNYFEVTGLSNKTDVLNLRASISYFSKKKKIKVSTMMENGILRVERIKTPKTNKLARV